LNWGFTLAKQVLTKQATVLLEPHLQYILLWLFFGDGGLKNYLPGLALNPYPLDVSLPSS
jgi:hypothetical protein